MRASMNDDRRLVGQHVRVSADGCSASGILLSSGNHGVVLDVNGKKRTFSGFASVHPVEFESGR